jgi:hypothetical protein
MSLDEKDTLSLLLHRYGVYKVVRELAVIMDARKNACPGDTQLKKDLTTVNLALCDLYADLPSLNVDPK